MTTSAWVSPSRLYGLDIEMDCVDYRSMTLPQDIVKLQVLVALNSEFATTVS